MRPPLAVCVRRRIQITGTFLPVQRHCQNEVALSRKAAEPLRVLVVDDSHEFVQTALRRLASYVGLEVVGCANAGQEALDLVETLRPDLVLMDLAMPGMNGLEATRRIKAMSAPPRVLILTLYDDPAYREAAVGVEADGFVTKAEWNQQMPAALVELFGDRLADSPSVGSPPGTTF